MEHASNTSYFWFALARCPSSLEWLATYFAIDRRAASLSSARPFFFFLKTHTYTHTRTQNVSTATNALTASKRRRHDSQLSSCLTPLRPSFSLTLFYMSLTGQANVCSSNVQRNSEPRRLQMKSMWNLRVSELAEQWGEQG